MWSLRDHTHDQISSASLLLCRLRLVIIFKGDGWSVFAGKTIELILTFVCELSVEPRKISIRSPNGLNPDTTSQSNRVH